MATVATGAHWDDQLEVFAREFRVIRYDLRGFGRSPPPHEGEPYSAYDNLGLLLDHLGSRSAHIAGWSMGSGIVVDFAVAYPDRTKSLIPVGPWVNGQSSPATTAPVSAPTGEAKPTAGPRALTGAPESSGRRGLEPAETMQTPATTRLARTDFADWLHLKPSLARPL